MTNPIETLNLIQIIDVLKHQIIDKIFNLRLKLQPKRKFYSTQPHQKG